MHAPRFRHLLVVCGLAGCAAISSVRADSSGLLTVDAHDRANAAGLLVARHRVNEEARDYCGDRGLRSVPIADGMLEDVASDELLIRLRFRCAPQPGAATASP